MATIYFLTASREYSIDGINWHMVNTPRMHRDATTVTFTPDNNYASIPIVPLQI
jgi:hypothetical protein